MAISAIARALAMAMAVVFFLVYAFVGLVVCSLLRSDNVDELILGRSPVGAIAAQQNSGAAHAEDAVGDELGGVVAQVPVECDVLHAPTIASDGAEE